MIFLTVTEIAEEFRHSRDTVRKKLADAGLKPTKRGARNVWRLRDVVPVLTAADGDAFAARARVQTDLLNVELMRKRGELIQATDVEREWARVFKILVAALEALPDQIERDVGASAEVLEHIERVVDELRVELYTKITGEKPKKQR